MNPYSRVKYLFSIKLMCISSSILCYWCVCRLYTDQSTECPSSSLTVTIECTITKIICQVAMFSGNPQIYRWTLPILQNSKKLPKFINRLLKQYSVSCNAACYQAVCCNSAIFCNVYCQQLFNHASTILLLRFKLTILLKHNLPI